MKNRGSMEPPEGYRFLEEGEKVQTGDLIWRPFTAKWAAPHEAAENGLIVEIGLPAEELYAVARRI